MDLPAVPAGAAVIVDVAGDLVLGGLIATTTAPLEGSDGPDITIRVGGTLTLLPGLEIRAADGRDGKNAMAHGIAMGGNGGKGGRVLIIAEAIVGGPASVTAGAGGAGGSATASGFRDAKAIGGAGGSGGFVNVRGEARALVRITDGNGGHGGEAAAAGQDGEDCSSVNGTSSRMVGRNASLGGGDGEWAYSSAQGGSCGPVDGKGGTGGDAEAFGGTGGIAQNATGGRGGNATAIAGTGGDGLAACYVSYDAGLASGHVHAGDGGDGGLYSAIGGDGGAGLNGGNGGDAYGSNLGGRGGNASSPIRAGTGGANGYYPPKPGFYHGTRGGDGGTGLAGSGGAGGAAVVDSRGGDQGNSSCFDVVEQQSRTVPGEGVLVLMALALAGRRRRPSL
ncbi:MAG: hypothetical protein HY556_10040 [Euryarchaeota archaeon]|nr:hypothetical protein [Euryarchaeota archaeon]